MQREIDPSVQQVLTRIEQRQLAARLQDLETERDSLDCSFSRGTSFPCRPELDEQAALVQRQQAELAVKLADLLASSEELSATVSRSNARQVLPFCLK